METRRFDLRIEKVDSNEVTLRLWSKEKITLSIRDIKFYYGKNSFDEEECLSFTTQLNDCSKQIIFLLKRQSSKYESMNFVIKDTTNNQEYTVRLPIPNGAPIYKEI